MGCRLPIIAILGFFLTQSLPQLYANEVGDSSISSFPQVKSAKQKLSVRPTTPATTKGRERKGAKGPGVTALLPSSTDKYDLGIGLGFFNLFLPQPALQVSYLYKSKLQLGLQLGYITLPFNTFNGQSTHLGGDVKFLPFGSSFYVGIAAGMRTVTISTEAPITVSGTSQDIAWRREAHQSVVIPRVGWVKIGADGTGTTVSLGYLIPMQTSFKVHANPDGVPGLPKEAFEAEREKKGNDVKKYTNIGYPHIEFSYFWYLDLF